jgi:hypothetical protein
MKTHFSAVFLAALGTLVVSACEAAPEFTCEGGGLVDTPSELAIFASCKTISGDVTLATSEGFSSYSNLRSIEGGFAVRAGDGELRFPGLTSVRDGIGVLETSNLTTIGFDALERTGTFAADRNAELRVLSLPRLAHATELTIMNNPKLAGVVLPSDIEVTGSVTFSCSGETGDLADAFRAQLASAELSEEPTIRYPNGCN